MIAAEPNEERRQRLIKTRDKIAKYGDNISSAIKDLKDLYDAGRPRTDSNGEELNADNPYDAAKQSAFNPAISELLNTVYNQLNGVSCKQMSSEQLQLLYNALRATEKVIRDSVNLRSSRIKMSVYEAGEELTVETAFSPGWTALGRIDTEGTGALGGQWILEEVRQDLKNGRTRGRMVRVI